ncbi:MAG: hypothetical protein ACYC90_09105 [Candidatus Nanopelagicales bacterium]
MPDQVDPVGTVSAEAAEALALLAAVRQASRPGPETLRELIDFGRTR